MGKKTKRGAIISHKGKLWKVTKILIPTTKNSNSHDYISAAPICGGQVLHRSNKTIGDNWEAR